MLVQDSHAKLVAQKLGLTSNATSANEISSQLMQILPDSGYIKFNDAIGTARQKLVFNQSNNFWVMLKEWLQTKNALICCCNYVCVHN